MYIQPVSYSGYLRRSNTIQQNKIATSPSFSAKEYRYNGNHSEVRAKGDLYGDAHIGKLIVQTRRPFLGDEWTTLSVHNSIDADRICSEEGNCIEVLVFDGVHKIGKIEEDVSELRLHGNISVDEIKKADIVSIGSYSGAPVKIGRINKAHNIMMSGNCSINSANTNFLEYSSIDRPGTIKIGMLEAGNINLYVSKEDFFEIGNLKIDTDRKNRLIAQGYRDDGSISGNVKVGNITFVNGSGELRLNDRAGILPSIRQHQITNGKLIYEISKTPEIDRDLRADEISIGNSSYNLVKKAKGLYANKVLIQSVVNASDVKAKHLEMTDSAKAKTVSTDTLFMNGDTCIKNAVVGDKVDIKGNAIIENLTITGNNAETFLRDDALINDIIITGNNTEISLRDKSKITGKIVFEKGNGKVYASRDGSGTPSISEAQIEGGELIILGKPTYNCPKGKGLANIVGMSEMKEILMEDIIAPMRNPEKYSRYGINVVNGFLMYGPPGCGKTFVAQMLAEETGRTFYEISPSSIGSKYQYEPQQNIKNVFQNAKYNAPSIIFIDEAEALLSKRELLDGGNSDTVGAVTEMLQQINNCKGEEVLVIIASNEPQKIDNAVKRTGRMDRKVYVGEPDMETRAGLFSRYLDGLYKEDGIDYEKLANLTEYYTADDIRMVVRAAASKAVKTDDPISEKGLLEALKKQKPSLSKEMVEYYKSKGDLI